MDWTKHLPTNVTSVRQRWLLIQIDEYGRKRSQRFDLCQDAEAAHERAGGHVTSTVRRELTVTHVD